MSGSDVNSMADRLKKIADEMSAAAQHAGRLPSEIKLLAVSKTKPLELIREAFFAGQLQFGENYVQEAVEKAELFTEPNWHLIGSLQTNKVKYLKNHFEMIQSVDRERLVRELENSRAHWARETGDTHPQDILIQVHIGDEENKQGSSVGDVPKLIEAVNHSPHLRLRGLMSLPPLTDNESVGRGYFALLKNSMESWKSLLQPAARATFDTLSMGTSHDFEWAILEGATMIRVGTAIFGSRD